MERPEAVPDSNAAQAGDKKEVTEPSTPYYAALHAALAVRADGGARLCGGYARASGEMSTAHCASQARSKVPRSADCMVGHCGGSAAPGFAGRIKTRNSCTCLMLKRAA